MYVGNNNINYPAVPPLYPMDPCRPTPQPRPQPMPDPYSNMPMCPMMDPMFRECVRICMMQCGNYPMPIDYTMDMNYYTPINPIDINESYPYYYEENKE